MLWGDKAKLVYLTSGRLGEDGRGTTVLGVCLFAGLNHVATVFQLWMVLVPIVKLVIEHLGHSNKW